MNRFLSAAPLPAFNTVYALLRMFTGALMVYHGYEVFDGETMASYNKWLGELHFPSPGLMAYLGKGTELITGLSLALGFLTRAGALAMSVVMLVICFGMGHGKFWYDDQHPFLFVILGAIYFFGGAGKWSLDLRFFTRN